MVSILKMVSTHVEHSGFLRRFADQLVAHGFTDQEEPNSYQKF